MGVADFRLVLGFKEARVSAQCLGLPAGGLCTQCLRKAHLLKG